jgi:hypothetical protein
MSILEVILIATEGKSIGQINAFSVLLEPDGLGAGIITAIPKFLRMIGDLSGTSRRRLRNRSAVDFGSGNGTSLLSVEII